MNRQRPALPLAMAAGLVLSLGSTLPANGLPAIDGRIVFQNDACQIDTINPDGSDLVQVTDIQHGCAAIPAWSPDGSQIAFLVYPPAFDRASIYTINTDGTGLQQLVTDGAGYYDSYPTYTPDGQWVIYSRCRSGQKGGGCALYEIRLDGTDTHPLTGYGTGVGLHSDIFPRVSPNGDMLAFARLNWHFIQSQIWVMSLTGQPNAHPITPVRMVGDAPNWAPDGKSLYLMGGSTHGINSHLFHMPATGGHATQLTRTPWPNGDYEPAPSPNGQWVVFASDRLHHDICCSDLFLMRTNGTDQHLVTDQTHGEAAEWSGSAASRQGATAPTPAPTAAQIAWSRRMMARQNRIPGPPPVWRASVRVTRTGFLRTVTASPDTSGRVAVVPRVRTAVPAAEGLTSVN